MHIIVWCIVLSGTGVLLFTAYVLRRTLRFEKAHKEYARESAKMCKCLDEERLKLYSMYLDAKAERRAYQMRRQKLEQHLKDGFARSVSVSECSAELLCLSPSEIDMLYSLLSKIRSKKPLL
jgi:hypothetical protein